MMSKDQLEEFELLLLDWEDGILDAEGKIRVQEILRCSPEARKRYVELQLFQAAMHLDQDARIGDSNSSIGRADSATTLSRPSEMSLDSPSSPAQEANDGFLPRGSWGTLLLACAASLLVCLLLGRWMLVESRLKTALQTTQGTPATATTVETRPPRMEATAAGIAYVTRLVDVKWGSKANAVGDSLSPGRLEIESGLAQIEFFCGATVVLQGPAQLDLESATSARLHSGRLRAQVPPAARGFQIQVDEMQVVDLGTEFGVSVTPEGAGVQVFDGEVELHPKSDKRRLITAGNAVTRSSDGTISQDQLSPDDFVDLETLEVQAQDQTDDRYERWDEFSKQLRKDPRLVAYYSMDDESRWTRKLVSTMEPVNRELDGAIVGAKRVSGRWPMKGALEFKRPGDRVRVDIPGEFNSLTFACWVKIDSLDRWYNSLFLTDSYESGEPHWQILETGQLFFSVRVRQGDVGQEHREVVSPPFWNPSLSGRWMHLATTYDVEKSMTTHYLNGEVLSRESIPDVQLVRETRIGKASIGNWSLPTRPDSEFAIRNLNGSIDEFALFDVALNAAEIRELYENGKP